MNRIVGLVALLRLVLVPMVVGTTPTSDPNAAAPIERLIQQLAHPDFRVREAAAQAIDAQGPDVLAALRKAQNHEDAEVRNRIAALLPAKERAAILAPKRVTLQMPKGKVRQAIMEMAKQTGYKIELWPDAQSNGTREDQVFDFQFNNVPFWEAMDEVCNQGGVVLQMGYGNDFLRLNYQDSYVPFVWRNGAYRVTAHSFHYGKSNDFSVIAKNGGQVYQNRSENLSLNISIAVEPKLPLLGLGQGTVTEAVDDQNRSMLVPNTGIHYQTSYGGYRSYSQQTQVMLSLPSKESKEVKYLRGIVPVTVLVDQKATVVVDNLMTAKGTRKFKVADTELEIEEAKPMQAKNVQFKMSIRDTGKDTPNDYSWCNSLYQRVEVLDAKGNKYQPNGFNWDSQEPKFVRGTFTFYDPGNVPNLGPPVKLIYYTWTMMQDQVTFEFKKLPLP